MSACLKPGFRATSIQASQVAMKRALAALIATPNYFLILIMGALVPKVIADQVLLARVTLAST